MSQAYQLPPPPMQVAWRLPARRLLRGRKASDAEREMFSAPGGIRESAIKTTKQTSGGWEESETSPADFH